MSNAILLLCDDENVNIKHDGDRIYWRSLRQSGFEYSLPRIVEDNAYVLKGKYLTWLYELGHTKIDGQSLIERFEIRSNFSMWWMSLLIEKSNAKSPAIYSVFRLLALDMFLRDKKVKKVVVDSSDLVLIKALKGWSSDSSIQFDFLPGGVVKGLGNKKSLIKRLPYFFSATVTFVSFFFRYGTFKNKYINESIKTKRDRICFISYFYNIDRSSCDAGRFYSRYWTELHSLLSSGQSSVRWLHLFVKGDRTPNLKSANHYIDRFNENESTYESHFILENSLSLKVLFMAAHDYVKVCLAGYKLRNIHSSFKPEGCGFNFWSILEHDWMRSFFGNVAMSNALYLNMFEDVFSKWPYHKKGFYLMENQAWERALIYSWRKSGNGELIGVGHTVVSEWDLRHFVDVKEIKRSSRLSLPIPDKVALNGEMALKEYRLVGFPEDKIIKVEALRYLYLDGKQKLEGCDNNFKGMRILVLGDILSKPTLRLIKIVSEAMRALPTSTRLMIKPHPACVLTNNDWAVLEAKVITQPLDQIESEYDIAITSNATASAVDALFSGKKVFTLLDPETFNMSPLKGSNGVSFFGNSEELLDAVKMENNKSYEGIENDALFIDSNIPSWKALLLD